MLDLFSGDLYSILLYANQNKNIEICQHFVRLIFTFTTAIILIALPISGPDHKHLLLDSSHLSRAEQAVIGGEGNGS